MIDPLSCRHSHGRPHDQPAAHARGPDDGRREEAATSDVTDLRAARRKARDVVRGIEGDVMDFLERRGIELVTEGADAERRIGEEITRICADGFRDELIPWLEERHSTVMGRAIRAALDRLATTLRDFEGGDFDRSKLILKVFDRKDAELSSAVSEVDAGLLYKDDGSLATEAGDRITRHLRLGLSLDEGIDELGRRVSMILTDGDPPDRGEKGVTGHTIKTKAELIAHDSIHDAYITAATRRYLAHGFKYARYDAVVDTKTTALCRRMNEELIDMTETPHLIPPNHPWCRSGIRPVLDPKGHKPLTDERVADEHLRKIFETASFRPTVIDPEKELRSTPLTTSISP